MNSSKQTNWFARHKVITGVLVIIVLAIIGSAVGSKNSSVTTTPTNSSSNSQNSKGSTTAAATKAPSQAHVGSTVDIGGSKGLAVTVQQVIDPASGADQYTTADAGKRFVAVKLSIQNDGTSSYSDDANNDVTVIGSDNQSYTADFDDVSECTNFNEGQFTLAAGESADGCVVYQVPNGVNAAKVQFQTVSGLDSSTGEWLVP